MFGHPYAKRFTSPFPRKLRAYIALKPDVAKPAATELNQFSRARVGYKAPSDIIVRQEMPRNATGKVDRVALKKLAEASRSLAAGTP